MPKKKKSAVPEYKNETRKVASIIPYANNYRTHSDQQVSIIAGLMKKYGCTQPPLLDEDGVIIAGHGRILAAQKLGLEEIDVRIAVDWSEMDKKAYLIADNKVQEMGGENTAALELEVEELLAQGYEDVELLALPDDFFDDMPAPEDIEPPEVDYAEKFNIVVHCDDEMHQEHIYKQLTEMGLSCQVQSL